MSQTLVPVPEAGNATRTPAPTARLAGTNLHTRVCVGRAAHARHPQSPWFTVWGPLAPQLPGSARGKGRRRVARARLGPNTGPTPLPAGPAHHGSPPRRGDAVTDSPAPRRPQVTQSACPGGTGLSSCAGPHGGPVHICPWRKQVAAGLTAVPGDHRCERLGRQGRRPGPGSVSQPRSPEHSGFASPKSVVPSSGPHTKKGPAGSSRLTHVGVISKRDALLRMVRLFSEASLSLSRP